MDWAWSSVFSITFIIFIFSFVGFVCLIFLTGYKLFKVVLKKKRAIEFLSLVSILAFYTVQIISAVILFIASGSFYLMQEDVEQSKKALDNKQYGEPTIPKSDPKPVTQATPEKQDSSSLMVEYFIIAIVQIILVAVRLVFFKKLNEFIIFTLSQFVDSRIIEDKADPLKIKVNYPLFLKKSKSNMFQKAIREDFEKEKQKIASAEDKKNERFRITKKKASEGKKPSQDTLDRNMLSGGFFSSRGANNQMEVQSYPSKDPGNRFKLPSREKSEILKMTEMVGKKDEESQPGQRLETKSASSIRVNSRR